jgi:hypothetical protein
MLTYESGALPALLSTVLATVIAYAVFEIVYNVYFHPLANFPGPPIARITVYWKAYVECIKKRSFSHVLVELHAKYGEIARCSVQERALTCIVWER